MTFFLILICLSIVLQVVFPKFRSFVFDARIYLSVAAGLFIVATQFSGCSTELYNIALKYIQNPEAAFPVSSNSENNPEQNYKKEFLWNQKTSEVIRDVKQAFYKAEQAGKIKSDSTFWVLKPYLMTIQSVDSKRLIDRYPGAESFNCADSSDSVCLVLSNGSVLRYHPTVLFSGKTNHHAIYFEIDPDGIYSGSPYGEGKSVAFFIYYNGEFRTWGHLKPHTITSQQIYEPAEGTDPDWFNWRDSYRF